MSYSHSRCRQKHLQRPKRVSRYRNIAKLLTNPNNFNQLPLNPFSVFLPSLLPFYFFLFFSLFLFHQFILSHFICIQHIYSLFSSFNLVSTFLSHDSSLLIFHLFTFFLHFFIVFSFFFFCKIPPFFSFVSKHTILKTNQ